MVGIMEYCVDEVCPMSTATSIGHSRYVLYSCICLSNFLLIMSQISWNIKNFLSLDEEDFGLPVLEALVKNSNMKKKKQKLS